ncbi:phosphoadenosine phosphosulfate reductase domain-containing protein [Streptomyces tendae]
MVEKRQMWPDAKRRLCTSALKRDPTGPVITTWVRELGLDRQAYVLNVMGVRGAESASRARKTRLALDPRTTSANRLVLSWNIIHGLSEQEVWQDIASNGLEYHPIYDTGLERHVDRTTDSDARVSWPVRRAASVGSHAIRMEGCAWHYRTMWSAMLRRSGCHGGAEWLRRAASCPTRYRTPTDSRSSLYVGTCVTSSPRAAVPEAYGAMPTTCCGGGGGFWSSTLSGTR